MNSVICTSFCKQVSEASQLVTKNSGDWREKKAFANLTSKFANNFANNLPNNLAKKLANKFARTFLFSDRIMMIDLLYTDKTQHWFDTFLQLKFMSVGWHPSLAKASFTHAEKWFACIKIHGCSEMWCWFLLQTN